MYILFSILTVISPEKLALAGNIPQYKYRSVAFTNVISIKPLFNSYEQLKEIYIYSSFRFTLD